jgi:hypothetical protein
MHHGITFEEIKFTSRIFSLNSDKFCVKKIRHFEVTHKPRLRKCCDIHLPFMILVE